MLQRTYMIGRISKDLNVKKTKTGKSMLDFSIAVDNNFGDKGATFFNIQTWNNNAEYLGKYGHKGDLVYVDGVIELGSYEKNGQTINTVKIVANIVKILSSKVRQEETTEFETQTETAIPTEETPITFDADNFVTSEKSLASEEDLPF